MLFLCRPLNFVYMVPLCSRPVLRSTWEIQQKCLMKLIMLHSKELWRVGLVCAFVLLGKTFRQLSSVTANSVSSCTAGMGNWRPTGHIRPPVSFSTACLDYITLGWSQKTFEKSHKYCFQFMMLILSPPGEVASFQPLPILISAIMLANNK